MKTSVNSGGFDTIVTGYSTTVRKAFSVVLSIPAGTTIKGQSVSNATFDTTADAQSITGSNTLTNLGATITGISGLSMSFAISSLSSISDITDAAIDVSNYSAISVTSTSGSVSLCGSGTIFTVTPATTSKTRDSIYFSISLTPSTPSIISKSENNVIVNNISFSSSSVGFTAYVMDDTLEACDDSSLSPVSIRVNEDTTITFSQTLSLTFSCTDVKGYS